MNRIRNIPTGRALKLRRLAQKLLDPNPDIDAALVSFLMIGWGVLGWYLGV
jgi:hypothetical protein